MKPYLAFILREEVIVAKKKGRLTNKASCCCNKKEDRFTFVKKSVSFISIVLKII
jgi:hypothetical protein